MVASEEEFVLWADGRDKVVDSGHLDHGEERDEYEPPATDLPIYGHSVHSAPDATALVGFFEFPVVYCFRIFAPEERVDLVD